MIEQSVPERLPAPESGEQDKSEEVASAPMAPGDLVAKQRLDAVAGRIAGSGGLVLLLIVLITILMVTRPFGR